MATTFTRMDLSTPEQWAVIGKETFENQGRVAERTLGPLQTAAETQADAREARVGDRVVVGGLGLEGVVTALRDGSAEVDVRAGTDGLRTLWFRVLKFENGDEGGPIALVRAIDDRAEVYGIGSFRGPAGTMHDQTQMVPCRCMLSA